MITQIFHRWNCNSYYEHSILKPLFPTTPSPPTDLPLASPQAGCYETKCMILCYLLTSSGKASEEGIVFLFRMLQQGDDTLMVR